MLELGSGPGKIHEGRILPNIYVEKGYMLGWIVEKTENILTSTCTQYVLVVEMFWKSVGVDKRKLFVILFLLHIGRVNVYFFRGKELCGRSIVRGVFAMVLWIRIF